MAKSASVFGIYPDSATASDAVEALKSSGFRATDISVFVPDNVGSKDFAHEKHSKAPEGAVAGGATGGVLGGAAGWLLGAGLVMVPGLESFAAAGPIIATLGGVGAGAVLGGVTGGIMGLGVPEYEARRYSGRIRRGGVLLSVHCDDAAWVAPAKSVLKKSGAVDIGVRRESRADFANSSKPMPRAGRTTTT